MRNPADRRDIVGEVVEATPAVIERAFAAAMEAAPVWHATPPAERAACLEGAAALMETRLPSLLGPIVREAGKTLANAIGEVREAVDFCRYYGAQLRNFANDTHRPLGAVACISPWNFPLAIFTGQVAAALAAGNVVLAKPAEETPLIAAMAVRLLHEAGVPRGALQLLPGDGAVGAALVRDARIRGVVFTGSTEVARLIQRELAGRLNPDGQPVPLIAETGGQNALIVDSSALPEQVVADVLTSAFDSAGQRCSALRVLCLQEEIADRVLAMLKGALAELAVGNPDRLATDVGPVISDAARDGILAHVAAMRRQGRRVHALALPPDCAQGSFVAPTLIEIEDIASLQREVFGPVLHVLRFRREALDAVVDAVNATGYGLTFGVHSRIDETIERITRRIAAGNIYVNRNLIGAVVGVQPFGGHGLSGTGPKAGGPLYLRRLLAACPGPTGLQARPDPAALAFAGWLAAQKRPEAAEARAIAEAAPLHALLDLPGPVGERNRYGLEPRGEVLCVAMTESGLLTQIAAALATGNRALLHAPAVPRSLLARAPVPDRIAWCDALGPGADAVLFEGDADALATLCRTVAGWEGPVVPVITPSRGNAYPLEWLLRERAVSTNTAAAGGNASLMTIG